MSIDNLVWQIQQLFHNYAGMPCTRSLQKLEMFTGSIIPKDCTVVHSKPPKASGISSLPQQHNIVDKYWIHIFAPSKPACSQSNLVFLLPTSDVTKHDHNILETA